MSTEPVKTNNTSVDLSSDLLEGMRTLARIGRSSRKDGRIAISDSVVQGLRVYARSVGTISFHVHYQVGHHRPMCKIGNFPDMSIEDARALARTIISLGVKGIDPILETEKRMLCELREQGADWQAEKPSSPVSGETCYTTSESAFRRGYTQGAMAVLTAANACGPKDFAALEEWADGELMRWRAAFGSETDPGLPPSFKGSTS